MLFIVKLAHKKIPVCIHYADLGFENLIRECPGYGQEKTLVKQSHISSREFWMFLWISFFDLISI